MQKLIEGNTKCSNDQTQKKKPKKGHL